MNKDGFTIVELLIVIVIIGILLTIGVVGLGGVSASARDNERANDAASIARLLEDDYSDGTSGAQNTTVPSYPAMNQLVTDIAAKSGSAKGADPNIFEAPGQTASSVVLATQTDIASPNGDAGVALNTYMYQALDPNGGLCKDSSQTCVLFRLFYRRESNGCATGNGNGCVVTLVSGHQQ